MLTRTSHTKPLANRGFTIVELMIATAVFSTMLVLVTIIMTGIGNLYYKGVNQARTQDDVRSITDEVSQHLQLSDTPPAHQDPDDSGNQAYCIGDTRYSYHTGVKLGSSAHVLWRDTIPAGAPCKSVTLNAALTSGSELVAPNSRLVQFTITSSDPYALSVMVAYGDDDLLCNPGSGSDGCNTTDPTNYSDTSLFCHGSTGDQFCATSRLTTTVAQRKSR